MLWIYLLKISSIGVFHDDIQTVMLDKGSIVPDDILVSDSPEYLSFFDGFLLMLLIHMFDVDLFHNILFLRDIWQHPIHYSIRSPAKFFHNSEVTHTTSDVSLVLLHLSLFTVDIDTVHYTSLFPLVIAWFHHLTRHAL